MTRALPVFMWLAGAGFILSLLVHLTSLAGIEVAGGQGVFALHVGIFVVWLPTVLVMMRMTHGAPRKDIWKTALAGAPPWMRLIVRIVVGYGLLNFVIFAATKSDAPSPAGPSQLGVARGFSGHWLIFYSVAFTTLYSARHRPDLLKHRKCSSGHSVSAGAGFCETCGERLDGQQGAT